MGLGRVVRHDRHPRAGRVERPWNVGVLPESRRSDDEHDVVGLESRPEPLPVRGQVPCESRVVVRKSGACAERLLPHGRVDRIGDLDERRPAHSVVCAPTDDDRRALGLREHRREQVDGSRIRRCRPDDPAGSCLISAVAGRRGPVVHRRDDESRASSGHGFVVGAADRAGKILRTNGLVDPHRVVARQPLEPTGEKRLVGEMTPILLPDDDHERSPVHACGRERTDCIAEPGGRVQERDSRLGSADREAGCNADHGRLVEREHELQIARKARQERHLRRPGIREQRRELPLAKDVDDGVTHGRTGHGMTLT